jgi:hypothetical protein
MKRTVGGPSFDATNAPRIASLSERKLQMEGYDGITSWEKFSIEKLVALLRRNADRLAIPRSTAQERFTRAVIIGNLAMMIAEKAAQVDETPESPAEL